MRFGGEDRSWIDDRSWFEVPIGGIRCVWVVPTVPLVPFGPAGKVLVLESDLIGLMSLTLDGVVPMVWLGSIVVPRKLRSVPQQRCFSFIFATIGAKM